MLMPSRTKFRKERKGRLKGPATRGNEIAYGDYGLMSVEAGRVTSRQIEAARQAMTRYVKRGSRTWIRVFPHTPVTKKPQDVKMGGGKGNPEFFVARVYPGTVLFEMQGADLATTKEALRLAAHKLPVRTRFVSKAGIGGEA